MDSVNFKCPICKVDINVKSSIDNGGEEFSNKKVPVAIAAMLRDTEITCHNCNYDFTIECGVLPPANVSLKLKEIPNENP